MKQALLAIPLITLSAFAPVANAEQWSQSGGTEQRICYKEVYREEYTPGTRNNPGYVRRWTDKVRTPCRYRDGYDGPQHTFGESFDDNSCIEGSVLGGIAGGALGAGLSRDEGNLIGIPLGIVGGALIGCQIDGG